MANWPGTPVDEIEESPQQPSEQPIALGAIEESEQFPGIPLEVDVTDTGSGYDPEGMSGDQLVALEQQGYSINPETGLYEISQPESPVEEAVPTPDDRGFWDNLNRHLVSIRRGLAGVDDIFLGLGPSASNALFGTNFSTTPSGDRINREVEEATAAGYDVTPRGDGELLTDAALQGVGGALPLAAAGVLPALPELLAGGAAGLSSEYARQQGAGPVGQLAAGLGGAVAAPTSLAGAAKARGAFGKRAPNELMQAFDRQQVPALPADVGGPAIQRMSGAAVQAPLSASPVINASQRVMDAARNARGRIAASVGRATDVESAGQAAAQGARKYIKQSRDRIGRIYDTAAGLSGDTKLPLPKAKQILDEQISALEAVPGGGSGLTEAKALRGALDGEFPVQGIRDMRTEMFVSPEFRGTPVERRMRQIVDAASEDIEDGLVAAGKIDAAKAFATADRQWKERLETIKRVIEPVIGKSEDKAKSGEEIVAALNRAGKGNGIRAEKFIATLPPDEASIVRASLIDNLGRAPAGQQNAAGDVFSLSTFLTDWNKIGERAKSAYFGPESRAALNDLAKIAEATKKSQSFANHSNTAGGIWGNLGLLAGAGSIAPTTSTIAGVTQLIGGRLLASPQFARWLASAPRRTSQTAQLAHIKQLTKIAASQPVIANDVLSLQERLTQVMTQSPTPLAAEDKQDGSPIPPQ